MVESPGCMITAVVVFTSQTGFLFFLYFFFLILRTTLHSVTIISDITHSRKISNEQKSLYLAAFCDLIVIVLGSENNVTIVL